MSTPPVYYYPDEIVQDYLEYLKRKNDRIRSDLRYLTMGNIYTPEQLYQLYQEAELPPDRETVEVMMTKTALCYNRNLRLNLQITMDEYITTLQAILSSLRTYH